MPIQYLQTAYQVFPFIGIAHRAGTPSSNITTIQREYREQTERIQGEYRENTGRMLREYTENTERILREYRDNTR